MSKGKVLVTGACGYIGSHTWTDLLANGFEVVGLDNFSRSSPEILKGIEKISGKKPINHKIDLRDEWQLNDFFEKEKNIDAIVHFAAFKSVGESVQYPLRYFENNVGGMINLLKQVEKRDIKNFVFSSSCSVYGNAKKVPVTEETILAKAESPYARTKQICEQMLEDFALPNESKIVSLRYFNPAGAHPSNCIGEYSHGKPQNLMPVMVGNASGKFPKIEVFGTDYPTRDGSCIRDYIYIMDLAQGHTKTIEYLFNEQKKGSYQIFNLGTGTGVSVFEMLNAFERETLAKLNYDLGKRREGDVIEIYADPSKAKEKLHWEAKYTLGDMVRTAWNWELKNNQK